MGAASLLAGFSASFPVRLLQGIAVFGAGALIIGGAVVLAMIRLAGWGDPESEADFDFDAVAEGRAGPIAVVPYGTDDGLRSSQMNGGVQEAGCRTRSGEFWFPSVKGAVRIDPVTMLRSE